MENVNARNFLKIFLITNLLVFAGALSVPDLTLDVKSIPLPPPLEGDANYATLLATETHTTLYCPRFEQSVNWDTKIRILNPNEIPANVQINFHEDNGLLGSNFGIVILPYNIHQFHPRDFGVNDVTGSIVIESDIGVVGTVIRTSQYSAAAEMLHPAQSIGPESMYCPEYRQDGNWNTYITVNNEDSSTLSAEAIFYDTNGIPVHTEPLSFNAHQTQYLDVSDYVEGTQGGSIEIKPIPPAHQSLKGNVIVTDDDMAYSYALQEPTQFASAIYRCLISPEFQRLTTVELTNPSENLIHVTYTFFDEDGTWLCDDSMAINPHATFTINPSLYVSNLRGTIAIISPDGEFVGSAITIGTNGAAYANGLMTKFAGIVYAPAIRDTIGISEEFPDWGGSITVTNPWDTSAVGDALYTFLNGEVYFEGGPWGYIPPFGIGDLTWPNPGDFEPIFDGGGIIGTNPGEVTISGHLVELIRSDDCGNCNDGGPGTCGGTHCGCDDQECEKYDGHPGSTYSCACQCASPCQDLCKIVVTSTNHCDFDESPGRGPCGDSPGSVGCGSHHCDRCPSELCLGGQTCSDPDPSKSPPCGGETISCYEGKKCDHESIGLYKCDGAGCSLGYCPDYSEPTKTCGGNAYTGCACGGDGCLSDGGCIKACGAYSSDPCGGGPHLACVCSECSIGGAHICAGFNVCTFYQQNKGCPKGCRILK
jgi:hypothetical protein